HPSTAQSPSRPAGRAARALPPRATGGPAASAVTLVDGLVFSRTALYHSVNYRSVVCFAHVTRPLDVEVAARVLEAMIARYFPGRTAGRDDATNVVALEIEEGSAQGRRGGPRGARAHGAVAPGGAGLV